MFKTINRALTSMVEKAQDVEDFAKEVNMQAKYDYIMLKRANRPVRTKSYKALAGLV